MLRMPGIRTNAAAEVLGVSPNTLRSWERRYGFPTPKRTVGNHRNYELVELQTLRDDAAVRPWIATLTRRLCVDKLRGGGREHLVEEPLEDRGADAAAC